jgi:hypothetical protein
MKNNVELLFDRSTQISILPINQTIAQTWSKSNRKLLLDSTAAMTLFAAMESPILVYIPLSFSFLENAQDTSSNNPEARYSLHIFANTSITRNCFAV